MSEHNIHGIKPNGSPAAIAFECDRCGENHVHRSGFSEECAGGSE